MRVKRVTWVSYFNYSSLCLCAINFGSLNRSFSTPPLLFISLSPSHLFYVFYNLLLLSPPPWTSAMIWNHKWKLYHNLDMVSYLSNITYTESLIFFTTPQICYNISPPPLLLSPITLFLRTPPHLRNIYNGCCFQF